MTTENASQSSLNSLCADRRLDRRVSHQVSLQASYCGNSFSDAPVVECCQKGARVVLSDVLKTGDPLHIILQNPVNTRKGMARVAWVNPLSNGRAVVGLEFRYFK